jgi:hypothetical protein
LSSADLISKAVGKNRKPITADSAETPTIAHLYSAAKNSTLPKIIEIPPPPQSRVREKRHREEERIED